MEDFEKKYRLAKSRAERYKKSQKQSEDLLEKRSRDLYKTNVQLAKAQKYLEDEVEQATYELNVANQRLRKSLNDKLRLIGAISHEVRTPLNAVIGLSELIQQDNLNKDQNKKIKLIHLSGLSMLNILDDILEMTRIDSGQGQLKPIEIDTRKSVEHLESLLALAVVNKGLKWQVTAEGLPGFVKLDIRRYKQIVSNLINNAVKHTDEGLITVECSFEQDDQDLQLGMLITKVIDTGEGISKEGQASIFEWYEQVKSSKYIKSKNIDNGIGFGLPISKKLCEVMMGQISCESEVGKGSIFSFSVPVSVLDSLSKDKDKDVIQNVSQMTNAFSILVAEDTPLNQQLIHAQLRQLGQSVDIVDNGQEALDALEQNNYDVVILDIMMPVLDGEETIEAIRSSKLNATQYCIALTAASYKEQGKRLLGMGFNQFLSKPLTLKELAKALQKFSNQPATVEEESSKINEPEEQNFHFLMQQFGEDFNRIFQKIAPTYIDDSKENLLKLKNAITSEDNEKIRFISHAMKGEAQTFGFNYLAEILLELETASSIQNQTPRSAYFEELIQKIETDLVRLIEEINQELENLN